MSVSTELEPLRSQTTTASTPLAASTIPSSTYDPAYDLLSPFETERRNNEVAETLKRTAKALLRPKENYFDHNTLERLNINLQKLDLVTGMPEQGECFLKPMSCSKVEELLQKTKPWFAREDYVDEGDLLTDDFYLAVDLGNLINSYLIYNCDEREPGIIPQDTNWMSFERKAYWQATDVYRYCPRKEGCSDIWQSWSCEEDSCDPSKPHATCFIADKAPLLHDQPSSSELNAVAWLAYTYSTFPKYCTLARFPITVISASGRAARVVQGIVDMPAGTIDLRMSRLIHFEHGVTNNWDDFLTLLGWVIGDPVGNLEYSQ